MKILSKKNWNDLQDLVVGLQQDLNYTKQQLKISQEQVEYLQGELSKTKTKRERKIRKEKEDGTKPKKTRKNVQEK